MTTALEIMDWYIDHYAKLGHIDTVRKLKQIREDMVNADKVGSETTDTKRILNADIRLKQKD